MKFDMSIPRLNLVDFEIKSNLLYESTLNVLQSPEDFISFSLQTTEVPPSNTLWSILQLNATEACFKDMVQILHCKTKPAQKYVFEKRVK